MKHCRLILRDFWVRTSFGDGFGGIITFISKTSCPSEAAISETVLCVGRAHRICIEGNDCKLVIHNVHNFELQSVGLLCSTMDNDITLARADPLKFCFFAAGDFNAPPANSQLFEYRSPATHGIVERSAAPRPVTGRLIKSLTAATEIFASAPTRYNTTSDSGVILDRVFTTLPANVLILCKVCHNIEQDPKELYKSGISDHAPVAVSILHRTPLSRGEGPIAPEMVKHPLYSHYLRALLWEEKFPQLIFQDAYHRLAFLKNIMRASAGFVRDFLQNHMDHLPIVRSQTMTSIARAVWTQSIPLAETLLKHSGFARDFVKIIDNNVVITDNNAYATASDHANTQLLEERAREIQSNPRHSVKKLTKVNNLAKLWIPMSRTLSLAGIKVDGRIIRQEPELSIAMGRAWQPTFSPKEFCQDDAERYLAETGNFGEYSETPPPDEWTVGETIWSLGDSQPGADGLPYSAWRGTGLPGVTALVTVDRTIRSGVFPPRCFNESVSVFSPKGSQPHDPVEVIREPLQTRPLSLKNTDNKIIVASNVRATIQTNYSCFSEWFCQR